MAKADADFVVLRCRSIAQGCSEYNITVLIDGKDSVRALRAVHSRFYLATLPLAVGIVGPGAIGSTFMRQLMQQKEVQLCLVSHSINEHNSMSCIVCKRLLQRHAHACIHSICDTHLQCSVSKSFASCLCSCQILMFKSSMLTASCALCMFDRPADRQPACKLPFRLPWHVLFACKLPLQSLQRPQPYIPHSVHV